MSGDKRLAVFTAGVQTGFSVPSQPKSPPKAIRDITPKTERRRAEYAWKAACRLRLLIELWCRFLKLGLVRARLDDVTEDAIAGRFPGLQSLGGVLNMLAQGVEWEEDVAQALPGFDQAHRMGRGPTERRQNDAPKDFGARAIQGLVEEFLRLMRTDAECLHLLEVRKGAFERPWEALLADLKKLTRIDRDFSGDLPRLDFAKALKDGDFQDVRGHLVRELQELVDQLETYPEAVLRRPEVAPGRKGRPAGQGRGPSLDVANKKVRDYLLKHHKATSTEIAKAIWCSPSQVRSTPAWKAVSGRRRRGKGGGKKIGYEIAEELKAEETWKRQEEEDAEEEKEPGDRQQKLEELIEQQEGDQRADKRRPRRRKK